MIADVCRSYDTKIFRHHGLGSGPARRIDMYAPDRASSTVVDKDTSFGEASSRTQATDPNRRETLRIRTPLPGLRGEAKRLRKRTAVPRYAVECQSSNERGACPVPLGVRRLPAGVTVLPGCPRWPRWPR